MSVYVDPWGDEFRPPDEEEEAAAADAYETRFGWDRPQPDAIDVKLPEPAEEAPDGP